jgi:membrane protein DedA with SNARE-associated domain
MSILVSLAAIAVKLVQEYGYPMLFLLMFLESSSIPVPSEVVLPLAGVLAFRNLLHFWPAFAVTLAGSALGLALDYYIGFILGKDVVYRHLHFFHLKKESINRFDSWFNRNAVAAVFFSRLLPVVRTIMSFPAGFARMPAKRFFLYSITGAAIWDMILMLFGFYALSTNSAVVWMGAIGGLAIALFVAYKVGMRRLRR